MSEKIDTLLRTFRKERGLTQEELARAMGVSRQTIISIEKGKYIPSLPLAIKLGRYFKCGTDGLFKLREV